MSEQTLPSSFSSQPAPDLVARVHFDLLRWYAVERRDLPWRSTDDPYAILVSEMMLQQTQVDRVLPKYRQFLATFPTLAKLASAPTAEVISAWVPLGYNRRAVSLQSIARQVSAEHGGRIPDTIDELLKLKGIGRYTAGAIACFAYHKQVATVDTNIRRVLHRIFLGLEHPEPKLNDAQMLTLAGQVLPAGEAYNWNQALMDLGATICTSTNPLRQLRKVAEKKTSYQAQPFTSTNRYFRGRIVDLLRSLPAGQRITLAELGPKIKPTFCDDDLPWLAQLIHGLAKDGLLDCTENGARLP